MKISDKVFIRLAMVFAVVVVIAVFSGCGGSDAPIHEHHPLHCEVTPEQCK